MSCDRWTVDLGAYLDGELDAARRRAVDEHLCGCAGCRGELDRLRRLTALVRSVPRAKAPPALARRIVAAAARGRAPRVLSLRTWVPALAVAAAVMLAAVIGLRQGADTGIAERPRESERAVVAPVTAAPAPAADDAAPGRRRAEGGYLEEKGGASPRPGAVAAPRQLAGKLESPVPAAAPGAAPAAAVQGGARPQTFDGEEALAEDRPAQTKQIAAGQTRDGGAGRPEETLRTGADGALLGDRGPGELSAPPAPGAFAGVPAEVRDEGEAGATVLALTGQAAARAQERAVSVAERADASARARSAGARVRVHLTSDDPASEGARVRALARAAGGTIVERRTAPALAALGARPDGARPEGGVPTRLTVRVPADRSGEFLAYVERVAPAPAPAGARAAAPAAAPPPMIAAPPASAPAAPPAPRGLVGRPGRTDAEPREPEFSAGRPHGGQAWTDVEVVIERRASDARLVVAADARTPSGADGDSPEAALAMKRMKELLEKADAAGAGEGEPGAAAVDTVMRVEIAAFRGDVVAEARRVRELAAHFGAASVAAGPQPVARGGGGAGGGGTGETVLRYRVAARHIDRFAEAVRLGTRAPGEEKGPPPATTGGAPGRVEEPGRPEGNAEPYVTVEITITRTPPPRPER